MSASSPQEPFNPLGKLVSVIGLLAVALYFSGWIYRWFYFGFFQVELTTLNLPLESFYIASFSLLFRSPWAILKTIAVLGVAILGMVMTFKAIALLGKLFHQPLQKAAQRLGLTANQNSQLQFLASLLDEAIVVLWLLLALYFLAREQGYADARRDAFNETSTLPAITIAMKGEEAVIGRKLEQLLENPSSVRIFGDRTRYDQLLGNELNQMGNSTVWRLLSDANGYLYVFPSLNAKEAGNRVPPVLIFPEGGKGDRLTILSPAKSF